MPDDSAFQYAPRVFIFPPWTEADEQKLRAMLGPVMQSTLTLLDSALINTLSATIHAYEVTHPEVSPRTIFKTVELVLYYLERRLHDTESDLP
jgi:hypothetical protein